jgi:hypothetical protein
MSGAGAGTTAETAVVPTIFAVIVFGPCMTTQRPGRTALHHREHQPVGWYPTFQEALDAVSVNEDDMREMSGDLVCIEEVQAGAHPRCPNRWFYAWDDRRDGFVTPVDVPHDLPRVTNFAFA